MTQSNDKTKTAELFRKYEETGAKEVRNEIVEQNLYLADVLARKYTGRGVDYEDLYQVASYALVLSAERFDPDKGISFSSYAVPTIIGEIKKYFRDTTWQLKVPRRFKEISIRITEAKKKLQEDLQHVPTMQELAEYLQISEEELFEVLESRQGHTTYSLDQEVSYEGENESLQFEKFLGEEEKGYDQFETVGVFEKIMEELTPMEKSILHKRFLNEVTQRELAEIFGISQMSVSRIEKAMKEKFRDEYYK